MKLLDIITAPWAIQPDKLLELQSIYATHLRGEKIDIAAIEQRLGRPLANEPKGYDIVDGVAVLPIEGVSARKMNLMSQVSGGVSTELVGRDLRAALNDQAVHSIILAIDSPGGTVDGTQALAALVRQVGEQKPVVTLGTGTMASAAYWYGSAAQARYISEATTVVGSIGVVARHMDVSAAEQARGVKTTLISAGRFKTVGSEYAPLSQEDRATLQDRVDYMYSLFVQDVANHLGTTADRVLFDMADGRVFIGQQAIAAGLVDGVATLEQLVQQLNRDRSSAGAARSARLSVPTQTPPKGIVAMSITREDLQAQSPELLRAILAEGHAAGALAERERVLAVEGQALPGHEALIAKLKADGRTTGPEAALAVLNAERQLRATAAGSLAADAPAPVASVAAPAVVPNAAALAQAEAQAEAALPLEDRCKARWDRDAAVRQEFGDMASFIAFTRAEESGRVKRLAKAA
jgi:signal peptide peptidase SppA